MTGIAHDIFNLIIDLLLRKGRGVMEHQVSGTDSNPVILLANIDRILPSYTILNSSNYTIKIGYQNASFPLIAGAAITVHWNNPRVNQLLFIGDGTHACTVDVIG